VSPAISRCELTHARRVAIDVERAREQHADYERALTELGCAVTRLPAGADMPDSVFIEDAAVVLDEIAIIARAGAISRRAEAPEVERALTPLRRIVRIDAPAILDGGDVLQMGRAIFVGASGRTNRERVEQLRAALAPFGYSVTPLAVCGCLHLKSAVTALSDDQVLMNRNWIEPEAFGRFEVVDVSPSEPLAANIVRIGDRLLYPIAFPRTRECLEAHGFAVETVDVSELAKAEGAVTCCSLIFEHVVHKPPA
jgi:dimethylargininase